MTNLIVCESVAAIVTHIRSVGEHAPNYGGHVVKPVALCGATVAWDTRLPVETATCRGCRLLAGKDGGRE